MKVFRRSKHGIEQSDYQNSVPRPGNLFSMKYSGRRGSVKKLNLFGMLVFLTFFTHGSTNNTPDNVNIAAKSGLTKMLSSIPAGFENNYGFLNREEFKKSYIGEAYKLYTIPPEKLEISYHGDHYIDDLKVWRFPIICDGRSRSLLTVAEVNGEWKAVEIGAAELAAEFSDLKKKIPLGDAKTVLLRLFQLKSDYLVLVKDSQAVEDGIFYPLRSAVINLGITGFHSKGMLFGEVLKILQEKFERQKDLLLEQNF